MRGFDSQAAHHLIEELPESEWLADERFPTHVRDRADPMRRALLTVLWDDEPEIDEVRQTVQDAHEELTRGETLPDVDLWRCLDHGEGERRA